MLDLYFKYRKVLRRLRSGALGKEMDHIATHFFELGYKRGSARLCIPRRMSVWPAAIHTRTPVGNGIIVQPAP